MNYNKALAVSLILVLGFSNSAVAQQINVVGGDTPTLTATAPGGQVFFEAWCQNTGSPTLVDSNFWSFGTNLPTGDATLNMNYGSGVSTTSVWVQNNPGDVQQLYGQRIQTDDLWPVLVSGLSAEVAIGDVTLGSFTSTDGNNARSFITNCLGADNLAQIEGKASALHQVAQAPQPTQPAQPVQPEQAPQPSQPAQQQNNGAVTNNDVATGIALGVLGLGAAIIANELGEQVFTESPPPNAPNAGTGRQVGVQIASIRAVETTFGFGNDEIFLLASNGQRFPAANNGARSIGSGEVWTPNVQFGAPGGLSVDLREYDSVGASDLIGNFAVDSSFSPGRYTSVLRGDGATYEVTYDVIIAGANQSPQQTPTQQPTPSQAPRIWTAYNGGTDVTVTDCRDDCEEDIGMIFLCQGYTQPAILSLPWLGQERGPEGQQVPLDIVVDGQWFSYNATLSGYGLVGHVPSVMIDAFDPLVPALQAGNRAQISTPGGGSATIGLRGSRAALDVFKAQCGWNDVLSGNNTGSPEPEPFWFVSSFNDFQTGRPTTSLIFGLPETDAIGFNATCQPGSGNPVIPVDLIVDIGARPDGMLVPVYIQTSNNTFQYQGQVFVSNGEWAGVSVNINAADPVWQAMQNEQVLISYGVGGAQPGSSTPAGAVQAISQFVSACRPLQQAPQQQVPQQQTPQQPAAQQNLKCDDGSQLSVTITPSGPVSIASIVRNGAQFALIEVPSALGKKYSNGEATFTSSGNAAQFAFGGTSLFCAGD